MLQAAPRGPLTAYEQERAKRVLMIQQKLDGVIGAADSLRAAVAAGRTAKKPARSRQCKRRVLRVGQGKRRSGRIAGQAAHEYNENILLACDNHRKDHACAQRARFAGVFKEACTRTEIYDCAHVCALGTCKVYDQQVGVTCHQCRQKTLGKRTMCSKCDSLFGQLCGDCLYMRYGENIDDALAQDSWTCPTCRDLCNCSFHRARSGLAPTGSMYRSAKAAGFKSVAHALVLNNLSDEARSQIADGALIVPGGYPEDWATAAGAPYPPPTRPLVATHTPSSDGSETSLVALTNMAQRTRRFQNASDSVSTQGTSDESPAESRGEPRPVAGPCEAHNGLAITDSSPCRSTRKSSKAPEVALLGNTIGLSSTNSNTSAGTTAVASGAHRTLRSSTQGFASKPPSSQQANVHKDSTTSHDRRAPETSRARHASKPPVAPQPLQNRNNFSATQAGRKRTRSESLGVTNEPMCPSDLGLRFPSTMAKHGKAQGMSLRPQFGHVRKARRV